MESSMEVPTESKVELPYDPAIPHLDIYLQKMNLFEGIHVPNVHSNTIYNKQYLEATQVPINRQMDKEDVVHACRMEYYSAINKNEVLPFAAM